MKFIAILSAAVISLLLVTGTASASWTLNEDGTGFVGKGDVQQIFAWNNKQLQDNANSVEFRTWTTTEQTWTCTNPSNGQTQGGRATSTTTRGIASSVARVRTQITGFILEGWAGTPIETNAGPSVNSCGGVFVLTSPAGDPGLTNRRGSCPTYLERQGI